MPSDHGVPKINAPQLHLILGPPYSFFVTLLPCDNPPIPQAWPNYPLTQPLGMQMAIYNGLHSVGFGVYVAKTQISLVVLSFLSFCASNFQGGKLLVICDVLSL
jgi:hypothetical protein